MLYSKEMLNLHCFLNLLPLPEIFVQLTTEIRRQWRQGNEKIFWLFLPMFLLIGAVTSCTTSQPETKTHFTIGVVNPNPGTKMIHRSFIESMQAAATQKGWQLSFTVCDEKENMDAAIQKLVDRHVDMIFSVTTPATKKVQKAIAGTGIAGVFAIHDPIQAGVVESLRHPGGNLTGIQIRGSVPKAIEWLLTIAPNTQHIYMPIRLDTKAAQQSMEDLQQTVRSLGLSLAVAKVNNEAELEQALHAIPSDTDAIFILHSILISTHAPRIVEIANAKKIVTAAAIGKSREGVIISFSPELSKIGSQASRLGIQVLKGEKVGDIPSEIADFTLGINLQSANQVGIEIPNNTLLLADYIVR